KINYSPHSRRSQPTAAGLWRRPQRRPAGLNEREYWNAIFAKEDPWNYASCYEQTKYRHTLELMPEPPIGRAIELGCAEGMFTEMLAPRVDHLLAVDISDVALERARAQCAGAAEINLGVYSSLDERRG